MVTEAALNELIDRARRQGTVSLEDIQKVLPIDSMTMEEISYVLTRLDQAGFDLEIDPALLSTEGRPASKGMPAAAPPETAVPPAPVAEERQRQSGFPTSANAPAVEPPAARQSSSGASPSMLPWILAFAIILIGVFAIYAFQ